MRRAGGASGVCQCKEIIVHSFSGHHECLFRISIHAIFVELFQCIPKWWTDKKLTAQQMYKLLQCIIMKWKIHVHVHVRTIQVCVTVLCGSYCMLLTNTSIISHFSLTEAIDLTLFVVKNHCRTIFAFSGWSSS